jgi:glycosyltransferase involved in cell wall biosynthesis
MRDQSEACCSISSRAPQVDRVGAEVLTLSDSTIPRMSIVIPTFNRSGLLRDAVGSALEQDTEDYEVVVVDDASQDNTWEYLEALDHTRLRAIRQPTNAGMAANWNHAVSEARAPFVYVLQDDDLVEPTLVSKCLSALDENPSAQMVIFSTLLMDGEGKSERIFWMPEHEHVIDPPNGLLQFARNWRISSAQVVFSRHLHEVYGGFDLNLPIMSDAEAILRWLTAVPVVLLPVALARRRVWIGSVTSETTETPAMIETMRGLIQNVLDEARRSGFNESQIAELEGALRQMWHMFL